MELKSFSNKIIDKMECLNININEYQISQLYNYMKLLIKWNEKIQGMTRRKKTKIQTK